MHNPHSQSTTPAGIHITIRRPQFNFSHVEKVWLADPIKTHFLNALSVLIPTSERVVNDIMRSQLKRIHDPILKQEVQLLIKQEGAHALMHRQSNDILKQQYPLINRFEKIQTGVMNQILKWGSPAFVLALPAAFEHFTAAISRDFLTHHHHWTQGKQNQAIEFVNWHCLEEIEHQAVCLDVYKTKHSSGWRLVWVLLLFWLPLTLASTFAIHLFLLHKDKVIYRPQNWLPYLKFVARSTLLLSKGIFSYRKKQFTLWQDRDKKLYHAALKRFSDSL
jgi:predicted metal-dependent hydrolase